MLISLYVQFCWFILWLIESWVEFSKSSAQVGEDLVPCSRHRDSSVSPPTAPSLANSSVERLLFEAQKESSGPSSCINSRASSQERLDWFIFRDMIRVAPESGSGQNPAFFQIRQNSGSGQNSAGARCYCRMLKMCTCNANSISRTKIPGISHRSLFCYTQQTYKYHLTWFISVWLLKTVMPKNSAT